MGQTILLLISIFYFFLIACFICVDSVWNKDIFSAVKLASYFAAVEAFVMLWFSLSDGAIEGYIFSIIDSSFHDYENVIFAYLFSCFVYFFVMIGVILGSYFSGNAPRILDKYLLSLTGWERISTLKFASFMFLSGVIIFVYFTFKIGGLSSIWENINLRTKLTAGLGYFQALYSFLIIVGASIIYVSLVKRRKYFILCIVLLISLVILGGLGQRAPVVLFVFVLLLTHHYRIKFFAKVFNSKTVFLSLCSLLFMFFVVEFRPGSDTGTFFEKFERNVVQRLGTIERQVVAIGYFHDREYWGWGVYESLLYAPIPRGLYAQKPPIDTGMYLNHIRQGGVLVPPVPVESLDPTSWPDGYLAGYVSFGFVGLLLVSVVSGFFYGFIYRLMVRSSFSLAAVILYAHAGFMGVTPFSPLGIVKLLVMIVPFMVLGFFSRVRLRVKE